MSHHLIGVISDTHGLLRPQAVKALEGVELIIHAGDLGGPEVLAALEAIAPVQAVRGNTDKGDWAQPLPRNRVVEVDGAQLYVLHNLSELDLDPGSAGPRRFTLPVTLALLRIGAGALEPDFVNLFG